MNIDVADLLDYTAWERGKWKACFERHGARALGAGVGPHGDGRFKTVGEVVRHIFSAEKRYVERLTGRPLTETADIPSDDVDALFQFGRQSRDDLRVFIETFPAQDWDVAHEHTIGNHTLRLTPRMIIIHVVLHEIRHWAQVATLLRLEGVTDGFHDILFSPVSGRGPNAGTRENPALS